MYQIAVYKESNELDSLPEAFTTSILSSSIEESSIITGPTDHPYIVNTSRLQLPVSDAMRNTMTDKVIRSSMLRRINWIQSPLSM